MRLLSKTIASVPFGRYIHNTKPVPTDFTARALCCWLLVLSASLSRSAQGTRCLQSSSALNHPSQKSTRHDAGHRLVKYHTRATACHLAHGDIQGSSWPCGKTRTPFCRCDEAKQRQRRLRSGGGGLAMWACRHHHLAPPQACHHDCPPLTAKPQTLRTHIHTSQTRRHKVQFPWNRRSKKPLILSKVLHKDCLLYTSPSPRDFCRSRMPSSA